MLPIFRPPPTLVRLTLTSICLKLEKYAVHRILALPTYVGFAMKLNDVSLGTQLSLALGLLGVLKKISHLMNRMAPISLLIVEKPPFDLIA